MSDKEYIEDRKYILSFIDEQKHINEKLFHNDEDAKIELAKLVTKVGMFSVLSSSVTSIIVAVIIYYMTGGK
jgi:hypothetical protein